jgi:hypothetical protein
MFNLYFTDWDDQGFPIPNGQAELDRLAKNNIKVPNEGPGKHFFDRAKFETMCRIANHTYSYTNEFINNFIFLIEYEVSTPIFELVIPLASIVNKEIANAINKNGYLVFFDNEGWLHMPSKLREQAVALGINEDKIIYITASPSINYKHDIFYNYPEEDCFYKTVSSIKYNKLSTISATKPTKLFTSLVGSANASKIHFLNKIINNNLFDHGNISLISVKPRYEYLLCKKLLDSFPITIDKSTDYFPHFTNTLAICSTSYINIVHSSDTQHDLHRPSIVVSNNDLFTAVATKRPFIAVSHAYDKLSFIKLLGYKTFDNYFSEEYNVIRDNEARIDNIITLLKSLQNTDLDKLLLSMSDTLEYNFNHFFRKSDRSSHKAVNKLRDIIHVN